MSTMTRVWTRRSAPERRRSAWPVTTVLTSRRRRSFPLRCAIRLFDLERPKPHPIGTIVGTVGYLEALPFAARPEAEQHGVGPGRRRHERDVDVEVIADV